MLSGSIYHMVGFVIRKSIYCKFENFRDNFIFTNSIKRHICDVRNLQLVHDIRISVNDRVILPFREGLNFTKLHICKVSQK